MPLLLALLADESGPPALRRLTPGVVGTLQYSAPELLNEDLRPQGECRAHLMRCLSAGVSAWLLLCCRHIAPCRCLGCTPVTSQRLLPHFSSPLVPPAGTEDAEWALKLDVWSFGVTVSPGWSCASPRLLRGTTWLMAALPGPAIATCKGSPIANWMFLFPHTVVGDFGAAAAV